MFGHEKHMPQKQITHKTNNSYLLSNSIDYELFPSTNAVILHNIITVIFYNMPLSFILYFFSQN